MKNSPLIWLVVVAAIVLAIGVYFFTTQNAAAPETTEEPMTQTPTDGTGAEPDASVSVSLNTIRLTDTGFSPATLTVKKGTTVTFINQTSDTMWIGADEHPTHTEYDGTARSEHCPNTSGTAFDQCGVGNTYSFTFNKVGTWEYHNHTDASQHGTVVVTE